MNPLIPKEHRSQIDEYIITSDQLEALLVELEAGTDWVTACTLADLTPKQTKALQSDLELYLEDELDDQPSAFLAMYYVNKALARRNKRWHDFVERGQGKQFNAGTWLLERRVGKEYAAPVQKVQQEVKGGMVFGSVHEALEATRSKLGIESIEAQGDYWAKLQTAVQTQKELPKLPSEEEGKK
jgi:hypothetical protein